MASRSSTLNRPDPSEIIEVPPDTKKLSTELDTKVANCVYFHIQREDHTIGNLVRTQLLRDPTTLFAGYRNPHPLEPVIELRVQSSSASNPYAAVYNSFIALKEETESLKDQLMGELRRQEMIRKT